MPIKNIHVIKDKNPIFIKRRGQQIVLFFDDEIQEDPHAGTALCKDKTGAALIRIPFCLSHSESHELHSEPVWNLKEILQRTQGDREKLANELARLEILQDFDEYHKERKERTFCFANILGSVFFVVSGILSTRVSHLCTVVHIVHRAVTGSNESCNAQADLFAADLEKQICAQAELASVQGRSLKTAMIEADRWRREWSLEVSREVGIELVASLRGKS